MTFGAAEETDERGAAERAVSRRRVLAGGALAAAAPLLPSSAGATGAADGAPLMRDVEHYVSLGSKRAGGVGDTAVGTWLEDELRSLGFRCTRHSIDVPWFDPQEARLSVDGADFPILPVGIPVQTPREGLAGDVRLLGGPAIDRACISHSGERKPFIAVAFLPHARWSSAATPIVGQTVSACRDAGAIAVLLVTTGPARKAVMLNADGKAPMFDIPVGTIGATDAARIAAGKTQGARLHLHGRSGRRAAFNLVARRGSAKGKHLIVSTPRSGWFACGAERGPGIAIWLDLARQVAKHPAANATFLCTSGHEFENLGAEHLAVDALPSPADTALWLHLGAGFAARDWHELGPRLLPLPSVDPQRFLSASDTLLAECRRLFAGQPGLEAPYSTADLLGGELKVIAARGYETIVGLFGAHRFHHLEEDDAGCVDARAMAMASSGLRQLIAWASQHGPGRPRTAGPRPVKP